MVHGILQFTPRIAFRYVLHRCESLDIRCRESLRLFFRIGDEHHVPPPHGWITWAFTFRVPWRMPRRDGSSSRRPTAVGGGENTRRDRERRGGGRTDE